MGVKKKDIIYECVIGGRHFLAAKKYHTGLV